MKASDRAAAIIANAVADHVDLLYLQGLGLASLPPIPPSLKRVRHLDLSRNRLASLNGDVWRLDELSIVDIGSNQLREISDEIAAASSLQAFDASENRLSRLPSGLVS